jgi:hypothetical protein
MCVGASPPPDTPLAMASIVESRTGTPIYRYKVVMEDSLEFLKDFLQNKLARIGDCGRSDWLKCVF